MVLLRFPPLIVLSAGEGGLDVLLLAFLRAAAEQNNETFPIALACLTVVPKYGNIAQGGDPR